MSTPSTLTLRDLTAAVAGKAVIRKVDGREVMTVLAGEILSCRDRSRTLPMAVSLPPPCRPFVTPGPSDRC